MRKFKLIKQKILSNNNDKILEEILITCDSFEKENKIIKFIKNNVNINEYNIIGDIQYKLYELKNEIYELIDKHNCGYDHEENKIHNEKIS
jgi:hypothetical protein